MAQKVIVAKIVFNRLPELQGQLRQQANIAIRKAGQDIENYAKSIVPVGKTGYLKNSIQMKMIGDLTAIIGPQAHYGIYVELGTYKMAARPYMRPAAEAVRPSLEEAMKKLLE